jgi:SAM-dependent methyltransferase
MSLDWITWRKLAEGLLTYVPGVTRLAQRISGGSGDARYCYSVWLRHLVALAEAGLPTDPKRVAELGPGDSLGSGLCALLTGTDHYYACDVRAYARTDHNLAVFEELVALFQQRAPIPGPDEYPRANPKLKDYAFPHAILTAERLQAALQADRVERIRAALRAQSAVGEISICYVAPWYDRALVPPATLDLVFSQAVLEHVDRLEEAYETQRDWLKPGGVCSHQIDFYCHHYARDWNGHWTYSDGLWKLIRGRRTYAINRAPLSTHRALLKQRDFEIREERRNTAASELSRDRLAPRFQKLTEEDLTTRSALIQAVKRPVRSNSFEQ